MKPSDATPGFYGWWQSRAPRERWMLAVMCVAVAAFVYWFALLRPLATAAEETRERRVHATATRATVELAIAELGALQAGHPDVPTDEAMEQVVLDSAAAAQVAISRRRGDDTGALVVGIDSVPAPVLFGWLDRLGRDIGVAPVALEASERNGALQAEVRFDSGEE